MTWVISLATLAYVLRLLEREYFRQLEPDFSNILFDSYLTSVWCVIITMTTVGYGDVFAVSNFGRFISILNALWGAFIISLLVSSIGIIFELNDNQKRAISQITNSKHASKSIKAYFEFLETKKDRRQWEASIKRNPDYVPDDYVPSKKEVSKKKARMEYYVQKYRDERIDNQNLKLVEEESQADIDVEVIKEQVLDMQTKFDYLISMMMKSNVIAKEGSGYALNPSGAQMQPSINADDMAVNQNEAFEFQERAKEAMEKGTDREKLRKPPPVKPISVRIREFLQEEEKAQQ